MSFMISTILLSAGLSSRFGSPKPLARIHDVTVLEFLQQTLLKSQTAEIIIVLGAHASDIKPIILKHKKIKVVHNKDYILGQTSSFKAGLKEASNASRGMLLLPVDYPFVQTATIDLLIESFLKSKKLIMVPTFEDKKGHPPIFDIQLKKEFLELSDSLGLNEVSRRHPDSVSYKPVKDPAILATFNTVEEFQKLKSEFI